MASKLSNSKRHMLTSRAVADSVAWYCAFVLVALFLLSIFRESRSSTSRPSITYDDIKIKGSQFLVRPCDEIYVVGEGETLHTISDKCGDPFIVERNPHIHDPDDVFPGLVIKITPSQPSMLTR
ncbi:uncharacterized protein LOC123224510 [Mangifera indica]|uniref:uncharacterized protein LOC123224510 n=1 Tax=Mangifera indica TaxID=29780 RepID=UPI001CF9496B|nr:uncharacterized protein LOC123224510 [Mangifera indica]